MYDDFVATMTQKKGQKNKKKRQWFEL